MKQNQTLTALIAGAALGLSGQVFAAGTTSGTDISNTATLDYTVGGTAQDAETVEATFKVDTRVDFTLDLQDASIINVTPSASGYVSTYTLANTSNEVLDFSLATNNLVDGDYSIFSGTVTDNFDVATTAYVESGANSGYQAGEDTATTVDNLAVYVASGDEVTIYVVTATVGSTQDDGDATAVSLSATAALADGSAIPDQDGSAFEQNTKQYVIADADRDGIETVNTAFEISTAEFTDPDDANQPFRMDVVVINDPICDENLASDSNDDYSAGTGCPTAGNGYYPKAIPGAMVKYTIHAKNTGSSNATAVTFSENIATSDNSDPNFEIELVDGSVDNIDGTTDGAGTIDSTDSDGANGIVDVEFNVIEVGTTVSVTFTAIVE